MALIIELVRRRKLREDYSILWLVTGFGVEEWYIAEVFRRRGDKAICLPALAWWHLFDDPSKGPAGVTAEGKVWNYFVQFLELGEDPTPIIDHFAQIHPPRSRWESLLTHTQAHLAALEKMRRKEPEKVLLSE